MPFLLHFLQDSMQVFFKKVYKDMFFSVLLRRIIQTFLS